MDKFLRDKFDPVKPTTNAIPQYFTINGQSGHFSHNWPFICPNLRVGEPCVIHVLNAGLWTHSMHLHANHFYRTYKNGVVQDNPLWIDVYNIEPMDMVDYVIPYMRPPDCGTVRAIGMPDKPLTSLKGKPVWPPFEEIALFMPAKGTRADPLDPNSPDISVQLSPLCYPMHDHSEPSQTSQGGNYNLGMISGMNFTGDRNTLVNLVIPTWDGKKKMMFYAIGDADNQIARRGTWPGPTVRVPRGAIFHAKTQGQGPPPHTIHWHGLEPTPINDGVGHCSMEIGTYTYQIQPSFIGSYFYHCHRNTVQHFEFGLYGLFLVDPPDAFFASIAGVDRKGAVRLNSIPIGACRDGKRRTAANLAKVLLPDGSVADYSSVFPGFNSKPIDAPDPLGQYPVDPHAMTVPYDVEALWVLDERDSVWSDMAPNARATYPLHGSMPGVNDHFHNNATLPADADDFFSFNDFRADYWYLTGVPIPAARGGTALIPANVTVPAALNSGVSGSQVSIRAHVGQTILIRCLDAAYDCIDLTLPLDAVIIAWDGRALGVPPFARYNSAYLVPAGQPIDMSVARRCDILIRSEVDFYGLATAKFISTRGQVPGEAEEVVMTAQIPINIGGIGEEFKLSGRVYKKLGRGSGRRRRLPGVTMNIEGMAEHGTASPDPSWLDTVVTNRAGSYTFKRLFNGSFTVTPSLEGYTFDPPSREVVLHEGNIRGVNFTAMKS